MFAAIAASALAQSGSLTVEVSSDTILVGNYFELKYTIENADINTFEPPNLSEFDIVGGPNTSTSISIVNGEVSQRASYAYYLEPADIGAYTIPPAYIKNGDQVLETPPIEIIAVPNPQGIIQQPGQADRRFEEIFLVPEKRDTTPVKRGRKI